MSDTKFIFPDGSRYVPPVVDDRSDESADSKNKQVSYKMRLTLVPRKIIWGIAAAREFGMVKYPKTGRDGWRELSKEAVRDAMLRHMLAYLDDPTGVAEDSKVPHLYHCLCNGSFLCEMEDLPLPDKELMDWWRETYRGNQN